MNKLMGFYELQAANLPSIPWKEYTGNEILADELLWTIRTAIFHGNDLNLPRLVGKSAKEAKQFADDLVNKLGKKGMVIYYPYFVAKKSGTFNIYSNEIVIEAVNEDLWNLVTYSEREVTIRISDNSRIFNGDEKFLSDTELKELLSYVPYIKKICRNDLLEGKSILIEWSFAFNSDINKNAIGDEYLVFYEMRTI